jgi:hypothetical protein
LVAGLFLILLLSVDSSLHPSLHLHRLGIWWSPWLEKLSRFSVADVFILIATVYTAVKLGSAPKKYGVRMSPYLTVGVLACIYLGLGLIYNLWVYTFWKDFLYDIKAVLYLTVPYLFVRHCVDNRMREWFRPPVLFTYVAISGLIDWVIVRGNPEYPSYFGLPVLPPLVPISVSIVGVLYSRSTRAKAGWILLGVVETINAANRLSLNGFYQGVVAVVLIVIMRPRLDIVGRFVLVLSAFVLLNLGSVFLVRSPLSTPLVAQKVAGASTRQVQLDNVLRNFDQNIPGVLGKGLGSTWYEYIPIPGNDIYSVGTSVGTTPEESLRSPVKFVFNWEPPSTLYKWGVVGTVALIFLLVRFYHLTSRRIYRLRHDLGPSRTRDAQAYLMIAYIFAVQNFTYIGPLKTSMLTAMIAGYVDHMVTKVPTHSSEATPSSARAGATRPEVLSR